MSEKATANAPQSAGKNAAATTQVNAAETQLLERALGNRNTGLMHNALQVSRPGDADEVEADRVARQVMAPTFDGGAVARQPMPVSMPVPMRLQRKCKSCDVDELPVRRKASRQGAAPVAAGNRAAVITEGGQPLPAPARSFFEPRFGHSFEQVRVHDDAAADRSARALHAKAYTVGEHISFARGEYRPETAAGKSLLAHELTHVLQQGSGIMPKRIQRFAIESVRDCNPKGFTDQNKIGIVNNPDGEVAYTVNGIPTNANPEGAPAKDPDNKLIRFPKDTELKLGQVHNQHWIAVCLKRSDRELSEVYWVRSSGITLKQQAAAAPGSAPASATDVTGAESWSGNFSDFDGKTDAEIAALLRSLVIPELLAVTADAEVRGSARVMEQAHLVLKEYIAAGPDAAHFMAFSSSAQMGTAEQALEVLMRLHSVEQIQMFVAQTDAATRSNIHTAAMERNASGTGGADAVITALEEYETLVIESGRYAESEERLSRYRQYYGNDWAKAAEALSHFSDEAIFLELRDISDNDQLRALRKAADRHGYTNVSMIVSAIIAAQDKTGIYLDSLADMALTSVMDVVPGSAKIARLTGVIDDGWSEDFTRGLVDGGLDTALGDAWAKVETEFSSPGNVAWFLAGYYPGLFVGIGKDIGHNVSDIAKLIAKLVETNVRIYFEPIAVLKEIYGVLEGLAKVLLSMLDAREFGYTAGRMLSATVKKEFTDESPFFKGMQVGEIVGMVLTEVALLFVGVGEATAALKAVRGTKMIMEVEKALAQSVKLQKFISGVADTQAVRLLKGSLGAGKGAGLLKGADAAKDLVKAEEILVDFARLEKAGDGALIAKQMQPLEYAVLTEKVKNPKNISLAEPPFHTQYTMEVKVGEHTYRRRPDGSWCRFSGRTCGHKIDDGLSDDLRIIEEEILPSDIGNGLPQTPRSTLRTSMKEAFDNFQLPSWAKSQPKTNWNAHHVIPWEFLDHGVFHVLRNKGLVWDHNAIKNGIVLPIERGIVGAENLPIHQSKRAATRGHPVYNGNVKQKLDDLLWKYELDPPTLQKEVDKLLDELKGELNSKKWAGKFLW